MSVAKSIFSLRAAVISLASTSRRADDPVWNEHPLTMALAPVLVDASVEVVALAAVRRAGWGAFSFLLSLLFKLIQATRRSGIAVGTSKHRPHLGGVGVQLTSWSF